MIRVLIVTLFVLTAAGCGKEQNLDLGEFASYVNRFEAASLAYSKPVKVTELSVKFGKMNNPNERAICTLVDGETPSITVNKVIWEDLVDSERESLIYHELGHCVLLRKHVQGAGDNGKPVSLMNPYALDPDTYEENHDYYVNELFSQKNTI